MRTYVLLCLFGRPVLISGPSTVPRSLPSNGLVAKGTDGYDVGSGPPAQDGRPPPVRFPRGVLMTEAELQIIEFLFPPDAPRPADLPDWLLALLEGDRPEELSHELITA